MQPCNCLLYFYFWTIDIITFTAIMVYFCFGYLLIFKILNCAHLTYYCKETNFDLGLGNCMFPIGNMGFHEKPIQRTTNMDLTTIDHIKEY